MTTHHATGRVNDTGQTLLPIQIRKRMDLLKGGFIAFTLGQDRATIGPVSRIAWQQAVLAPFLALLEDDIARSPATAAVALQSRPRAQAPPADHTAERPEWRLAAHNLLLTQIDRWRREAGEKQHGAAARFAALNAAIYDRVPAAPRQNGDAVTTVAGRGNSAWFCTPIDAGRFLLFYRVDPDAGTILYGWIADCAALPKPASVNDPFVMQARICAVTSAGALTIPAAVRARLGLRSGSQIAYRLHGNQCQIVRHAASVDVARPGAQPRAAAPPSPALTRLTVPGSRGPTLTRRQAPADAVLQ